ncbi:unnamed protein product [Clonostachys solani]|uniref:Cytochrome P450 n=1 Tax=Clonostachys solani TaxID=160281 RepID=A0A9N9ZEC4_9HYPO|nr:unnamed protein product [Clonostachys solani]
MITLPNMEFLLGTLAPLILWMLLFAFLVMCIFYNQANDIKHESTVTGPSWSISFIGPSMGFNFERYYAEWLSGPLSCFQKCLNIIQGVKAGQVCWWVLRSVIIPLSRNIALKALNSPVYITPIVVDVAPDHLGYAISVFIDSNAHIEFRKGLTDLFTRKSLGVYLPGQEAVYREYFPRFIKITKENGGKPVPFISEFRQMMCAVSLRTFVGHYLSDAAVKNIADHSYLTPAALDLVRFPVIVPYTKAWYTKKAADMVLSEFCNCAAKSKVRMAAGGEVACIMDAWTQSMVRSRRWCEAEEANDLTEDMEKPQPIVRMFNDFEIAQVVFVFLFSLQEATSSAVAWLFEIVTQRPDVLEKVREENLKVRDGVVHAELSMEQLESLTYTRAVVRELFRYRRPVLVVPYQRRNLFPIPDSDAIPKGTALLPYIVGSISTTTYTALYNPKVYEKPEHFDPERYYSADAEEKVAKNHLLFGGPHSCVSQLYTPLNLALCLGKASVQMDWQYHTNPKPEKIQGLVSTFPMVYSFDIPQKHCIPADNVGSD